jgi:hypothetical protein
LYSSSLYELLPRIYNSLPSAFWGIWAEVSEGEKRKGGRKGGKEKKKEKKPSNSSNDKVW